MSLQVEGIQRMRTVNVVFIFPSVRVQGYLLHIQSKRWRMERSEAREGHVEVGQKNLLQKYK